MELLIIKSSLDYIRFKEDAYLTVNLDKASVFPMDQIKIVQRHVARLREQGFAGVCIKKLVLTEEDL